MLTSDTTLTEVMQVIADEEFVNIIGHLTDLGVLSERIVAAHGGWDE